MSDLTDKISHVLGEYGELQRGVLQLIMSVKTISQTQLIGFVQAAVSDLLAGDEDHETLLAQVGMSVDSDAVMGLMALINRKLGDLDLAVDHVVYDVESTNESDEVVWVFVNKKATKSLQLATSFSEKEMKAIAKLLDMIFQESEGPAGGRFTYSVKKYDAENQLRSDFTYTLTEAHQLLEKLMMEDWLESIDGRYTLAPRALSELKAYLLENYENAITCHGCGQIITRGLACEAPGCTVRFHHTCYNLYLKTTDNKHCPRNECSGMITAVSGFK